MWGPKEGSTLGIFFTINEFAIDAVFNIQNSDFDRIGEIRSLSHDEDAPLTFLSRRPVELRVVQIWLWFVSSYCFVVLEEHVAVFSASNTVVSVFDRKAHCMCTGRANFELSTEFEAGARATFETATEALVWSFCSSSVYLDTSMLHLNCCAAESKRKQS